jgi:hypothetical protein
LGTLSNDKLRVALRLETPPQPHSPQCTVSE